jgi:hypothetical protein
VRTCSGGLLLVLAFGVCGAAPGQAPRFDAHGDPLPDGALARLGLARLAYPDACSLAFSPDGRWLASSGLEHIALIWDVSDLGARSVAALSSTELRRLWEELRGRDAVVANTAITPASRHDLQTPVPVVGLPSGWSGETELIWDRVRVR